MRILTRPRPAASPLGTRAGGYHGTMTEKAFTRATDVMDGAHPTRSVLRLLLRRPGRMTVAILAFALERDPAVVPAGRDGRDHRHRGRPRRGVGRARLAGRRRRAAAAELSEPHPLHAQLHDRGARHRRRPPQRPRGAPAEPLDRLPHAGQRIPRAEQGRPRRRERRAHAAAGDPPAALRPSWC